MKLSKRRPRLKFIRIQSVEACYASNMACNKKNISILPFYNMVWPSEYINIKTYGYIFTYKYAFVYECVKIRLCITIYKILYVCCRITIVCLYNFDYIYVGQFVNTP